MTTQKPNNVEHKITCRINTSVFYPWEVGNYFKHKGQRFRIEKIIESKKYAYADGIVDDITEDTPIQNQMITSLVIGVFIEKVTT